MKLKWRGMMAMAVAGGFAGVLASCSQLGYYVQAAKGEFDLLADARPIDDWLADPAISVTLKDRLQKVKAIRNFAASELALPDNGTFKTYTDIKRPYVLWNVVATPELSMRPAQWCFPIAGCVNYRGYYDREDAQFFATRLRTEGYDVQVAGVPAYSTLGWFNDPVLSSFVQYPDPELARLVFHELAHQVAYAPGDSQFNESFATTVEDIGLERWLAAFGNDALRKAHADREARKQDFMSLLQRCRKALEENYSGTASDAEKKRRKREIFERLKDDYQALKTAWGGYAGYDRWFREPLSNAHLASISTYHDFVPGFRALMMREKTLPRFYAAVQSLAALDKDLRHRQLTAIALQPVPTTAQANHVISFKVAGQ